MDGNVYSMRTITPNLVEGRFPKLQLLSLLISIFVDHCCSRLIAILCVRIHGGGIVTILFICFSDLSRMSRHGRRG